MRVEHVLHIEAVTETQLRLSRPAAQCGCGTRLLGNDAVSRELVLWVGKDFDVLYFVV